MVLRPASQVLQAPAAAPRPSCRTSPAPAPLARSSSKPPPAGGQAGGQAGAAPPAPNSTVQRHRKVEEPATSRCCTPRLELLAAPPTLQRTSIRRPGARCMQLRGAGATPAAKAAGAGPPNNGQAATSRGGGGATGSSAAQGPPCRLAWPRWSAARRAAGPPLQRAPSRCCCCACCCCSCCRCCCPAASSRSWRPGARCGGLHGRGPKRAALAAHACMQPAQRRQLRTTSTNQ
jgi:hypothetical protein